MSRLIRAYTYESCDSHVPGDVLEALGERPWVRQGRVLVFARTARAAYDFLVDLGMRSSFERKLPRVATGNDLDALTAAGLAVEGAVYVVSHNTSNVVLVHFDTSYIGARTTSPVGEVVFSQGQAVLVKSE